MKNVLFLTRWLISRILCIWNSEIGLPGGPAPNLGDNDLHIGLFTAKAEDFTPDMTIDKLTEASFAGYARVPLTVAGSGDVYTNGDASEAIDSAVAAFASTSTTSELIIGAFLADSLSAGTGNLAGFCEFLTPRLLGPGHTIFDMVVKVSLPTGVSFGQVITI